MPRYICQVGEVEIRTPAGRLREQLWIGIEVDGAVNLPYLSERGYDLIPAEGLSDDELRSVGVTSFDPLFCGRE